MPRPGIDLGRGAHRADEQAVVLISGDEQLPLPDGIADGAQPHALRYGDLREHAVPRGHHIGHGVGSARVRRLLPLRHEHLHPPAGAVHGEPCQLRHAQQHPVACLGRIDGRAPCSRRDAELLERLHDLPGREPVISLDLDRPDEFLQHERCRGRRQQPQQQDGPPQKTAELRPQAGAFRHLRRAQAAQRQPLQALCLTRRNTERQVQRILALDVPEFQPRSCKGVQTLLRRGAGQAEANAPAQIADQPAHLRTPLRSGSSRRSPRAAASCAGCAARSR